MEELIKAKDKLLAELEEIAKKSFDLKVSEKKAQKKLKALEKLIETFK